MKLTKGKLCTFNPYRNRIDHLTRIPGIAPDYISPVCVGLKPRVQKAVSRYAFATRYGETYWPDGSERVYLMPIQYIGRIRFGRRRYL